MNSSSGLTISHISYTYGSKLALDDVSLAVQPGQFCALLGPNGAGKSTLFSLLTRLIVTRQGRITVAGFDLSENPCAALAKIGVVFQQQTLDLDMSVRRNLTYFAALHGISGRDAAVAIDRALDQLDMRERSAEQVRALNGGHRRRMEIARALIHKPSVLMLDEATVGLDTASRIAITQHVHDLADAGLAVLWATHLVDEVAATDQVAILHRGKILAHDRADQIAGGGSLSDKFMMMTDGAGVA